MARLVEITGLGKSYPMTGGEVQVLRDLDLQVQSGEFVAIMGASGSGKSTLLHILGGLDRHTRGTYVFAGRDMQALSDTRLSAIRASEVGFIFQSFNLIPQLSVYENVELPFFYGPGIPAAANERVTEALAKVGLSHRLRHRPSELSGGEMQRVAIARAIVMSPRLVLADEPTGSLDSVTGEQILEIMQELNLAGATVLLVTHNIEVACRAQRQLVLKDGRFVSDVGALGRNKAIASLRYAARSLWLHRMRAILSTLGVVCGVISFVAMISIGEGAKRETLGQIEQLGLRNVLIRAMALTAEQERNARSRGSPGLKISDAERLKAMTTEVHDVAALRELKVTTLALTKEFAPQVLAVTPNFIKVQRLEIDRGRFISDADIWQRNLVCVLGYGVSNALGEAGRPGGVLRVEDALCNVVGVLKRFERKSAKNAAISVRDYDNAVILPLGADAMFGQGAAGSVDELIAEVSSSEKVLETVPVIRRVFELTHRGIDDYRLVVPQELIKQANQTQTTFNIVLGSIAAISLLVGGIGIMNTMLASVSERTREIGIRRAVGATREHIATQFLTEAVILTAAGGILGVILGLAGVTLVSAVAGWQVAVTAWALLLPLAMSILAGLFFGLYPAVQAAAMDPIDALRHE